ncbi:hypothetical protein QWY99_05005 [Flavobacterium branchiarum]|uniref:Uncharacterized protein n=1 Tax=Flavobacterium branchiarum TaxID=1114870 RepID=A0ABV5FK11_9FLAO|nr:hypothetical protein [Flavobacterium branchiarum]MDN3672414.1 hypothetical protein [Flavobacterium branchiarum]
MEASKRNVEPFQIEEIKEKLVFKLSYENLKLMNSEQFKLFGIELFKWLDELRTNGLRKNDLEQCVNEIYYIQSDYFDKDPLFEERIYVITNEIISFCASPFFWDISLEEYLGKWNSFFEFNKEL